MQRQHILSKQATVVIKVGSSLVTAGGQGVDHQALATWAAQIHQLRQHGIRIVWVSSGAIAEGIHRLGWQSRPSAINELQAAAAVGQMGLVQAYEHAFAPFGIHCAQLLLTHDDLSHRTRYLNIRSTLRTLLEKGVLPVINENDSIAIDEIKLGDNDTLGALVTNLIEADALIILTDQQGLYNADPRHNPNATLINHIEAEHPELLTMAGGAGSKVGTGGMQTKVLAAKRAALSGAATIVASGHEPNILARLLLEHETIGTLFTSAHTRISARKQWLLGHIQLSGRILIDEGAANALRQKNSSLLPVGCVGVEGDFHRGELVAIIAPNDEEIGRGLINYASGETAKLLQTPSPLISQKLGYAAEDELIHRDNMALSQN